MQLENTATAIRMFGCVSGHDFRRSIKPFSGNPSYYSFGTHSIIWREFEDNSNMRRGAARQKTNDLRKFLVDSNDARRLKWRDYIYDGGELKS